MIYAPNTVGKTRLAQHLKERDPDGVVLYNSFVEDSFTWDNDRFVLNVNPDLELLETIETQGLDGQIVENFRYFMSDRIEPTLDLAQGGVRFGIHSGDEKSTDGIKISRAEESVFVWSVFYSILNEAVETLRDAPDMRSTSSYDNLKLAVVDDPVSSMDDVRIVTIALALANLVIQAENTNLKFLITTHHALFFNVLFNRLRRKKSKEYILERKATGGWKLTPQPKDSPFSYHIGIIQEIKGAISEDSIERIHFNQFRALLEKTANFLGHTGGWGDLLTGPHAAELTQVLNLYSHDRFSDLSGFGVNEVYKEALRIEFQQFLTAYKWRVEE